MPILAIQYPSFGPQHPPRLRTISAARPDSSWQVVAMEMFERDSDYQWRSIRGGDSAYVRHTVVKDESLRARRNSAALRRAVWSALDQIRPDVLVVNGWGHLESRMSIAWCRHHNIPMVMLSDSVRDNVERWWWKEACKKWLLRGIRAGFAAGTQQARYLEFLGIPSEGIFQPGSCVVDNGYFSSSADQARARSGEVRQKLRMPKRYFLTVARFLKLKNIPFLIRAYAEYRRNHHPDPCGLVLCGSGPEESTILQSISDTKAEGVLLAGFRQVNELPMFYALATAFVLPSAWFECWGLVVNEAMACGLPVLVSRMVGCCHDLVHDGENGYSFDPQDVNALAEKLRRVATAPALANEMGKKSHQIIQGHSLEIGARNLWRGVWSALAGHSR